MKLGLLVLSLFLSVPASAWTVLVLSKPGAEWINIEGKKQIVKVGTALKEGETLITGEGVKVKLIENKSILVVGEKTNLVIEKAKDPKSKSATLFLSQGKVRLQIDKPEAQRAGWIQATSL